MLLLRLLIAVGVVVLPFAALALLSGQAEGMLWMIFPMFFGIPALVLSLLVFAPLEWLLDRRGMAHRKNVLVPLAGGVVTPAALNLLWGVASAFAGDTEWLMRGPAVLLSSVLLGALGGIWGSYWRLTEWAGRRILRRPAASRT